MKKRDNKRARSIEEIERQLREGKIVSIGPVPTGTTHLGRTEREFANLIMSEEDPVRRQKMFRRQDQLAVKLQGFAREERERIMLEEIEKWKNEAKK